MKAILVDLDGTLVDTHAANVAAYTAAIEEAGLAFSAVDLERFVGRLAWRPMLARILPDNEDVHFVIAQRKREIYAGMTSMVLVNDLLVDLLRALYGRVPIGLVTSASRGSVMPLIKAKGLESLFAVIVTSDDVDKQKPDPEPYQRAAALLNVNAVDCIVLEDSNVGIAAAKAFGGQVWSLDWIAGVLN